MQLSTVISLSSLLLPFASANCFKTGPNNVNKQLAIDNMDNVANAFQGSFQNKQFRNMCVSDQNGGYSWFFEVTNTKNSIVTIAKDTIYKGLLREVNGCGTKGGLREENDIKYRSDPNSGLCMDTKYINQQSPATPPGRFRVKRAPGVIYTFGLPQSTGKEADGDEEQE